LFNGSADKDKSCAPHAGAPGLAAQQRRADACPVSCTAPTTTIRHALRALASESGPGEGLNRVRLLRPLISQAHDTLRERFESGGSAEAYLRDRARLADSVVIGLLHIASVSNRIRNGSMVAPLAAVAVGGYGRKELAPGSDLDLLFLLPESSSAQALAPATQACIGAVVAGAWDLGFVLDHAARSVRECIEFGKDNPTVLAGLLDRSHLWGCQGLFTTLDAELAALFAGPDAGHWRHAAGSAPPFACRHAPRDMHGLEDEPDVKRDPGGLRDLQRALWANAGSSGHSMPLKEPRLVQAHRFLWQVRCHLHLLAGRAEDRLCKSVQPGIARQLGLADSRGPSAHPLLDLFRYHARNIVSAVKAAPRSPEARAERQCCTADDERFSNSNFRRDVNKLGTNGPSYGGWQPFLIL
jgi:[protein-PII] uridylyltransferase